MSDQRSRVNTTPIRSVQVPLLDLRAQYASLKPELDAAVMRVIESQQFVLGPEVAEFEREIAEYLGVKHALGVSSGTDALLLALMALDIGPGDEVAVPDFSFFATAGVVSRLGARPVLVDVDPVTFNIDPERLREAITERTAAIIPVHLFGQSAAMSRVMEIAEEHEIPVIEDAAQAIGTRYADGRAAGTIGRAGCFSFFPSKNLGGFGDGGLVVTDDTPFHELMRAMRVHGESRRYHHDVIGGNFRLDALQAAVLRVKLPHLDEWSRKRRRNAERYNELFSEHGLAAPPGAVAVDKTHPVALPIALYQESGVPNNHIFNQYVVRVRDREALIEWLRDRGVGSAVYYPVPFHRQQCFADLGYGSDRFPESERASREVLALPVFQDLTDEQLRYVVDSIADFYRK